MGDWALLFVKFNRFLVRSNATKMQFKLMEKGGAAAYARSHVGRNRGRYCNVTCLFLCAFACREEHSQMGEVQLRPSMRDVTQCHAMSREVTYAREIDNAW